MDRDRFVMCMKILRRSMTKLCFAMFRDDEAAIGQALCADAGLIGPIGQSCQSTTIIRKVL